MASIVQIQLRRDAKATWTANNPILALSEPGHETDTDRIKFGDGVTAWNGLEYFNPDKFCRNAGATIVAHRAVVVISDEVFHFDPSNTAHLGKVVGLSRNSAILGDPVVIVTDNEIATGLALTDGAKYFGGAAGSITTTPPATDISQVVGIALSTSELFVDVQKSILKL